MEEKVKAIIVASKYVVCPNCGGLGFEEERVSAYDSETVVCHYCSGDRVVLEEVIHKFPILNSK
jgi:hypothetical protein